LLLGDIAMAVKSMNSYVADELANKVKHFHRALVEAENIISALEKENQRLQDVLISLALENNKDLVLDSEAVCV
jgi:hypothetical protein